MLLLGVLPRPLYTTVPPFYWVKMLGLKALSLIAFGATAMAHVRMTAISVNGGAFVTDSVRLPPSISPVTDVTSVSFDNFLSSVLFMLKVLMLG